MPSSEVAAELKTFGLSPSRVTITSTVLLALTMICVAMRFYVKAFLIKIVKTDDWLLLAALATFAAMTGVYVAYGAIENEYGLLPKASMLAQLLISAEILYILVQMLVKASVALFFIPIVSETWQKRVIQGVVILFELYSFVCIFTSLSQFGTPTSKHLLLDKENPSLAAAFGPLAWLLGALDISVDWLLTLLPLLVVAQAMMPMRTKISVGVLILLGTVGSVAGSVRLRYLPHVIQHNEMKLIEAVEPLGIAAVVESALGMIAISLATLRPLFERLLDRSCSGRSRTGRTTERRTKRASGFMDAARQLSSDLTDREVKDSSRNGSDEDTRGIVKMQALTVIHEV